MSIYWQVQIGVDHLTLKFREAIIKLRMDEVEKIIMKRHHRLSGRTEYLVKSKGKPVSTWQPESHCKNFPHLIAAFNNQEDNLETKVKFAHTRGRSVFEAGAPNDAIGRTKPIKKTKMKQVNQPILTKRLSHKEAIQERKELPSSFIKKISSSNHQTYPNQNERIKLIQNSKRKDQDQVDNSQISNHSAMSILSEEGSNMDDVELFKEDPNFKVLEMTKAGTDIYLYYIQDSTSTRLVSHAELLREHTHALLDFYEAHLSFPEQQQTNGPKRIQRASIK